MARGYFANSKIYTQHVQPVLLDCSFTVASTDSGGYGLTGLVGGGFDNVFAYTAETPATGSPAPGAGYIQVNMSNDFPGLYDVFTSIIGSPETGAQIPVSTSGGMTAGTVYIIDAVGTTTTAGWQSIGVPVSVQPAQGVSFIANSTAHSPGVAGTGQVKAASYSGLTNIEVVGSGALTLAGHLTQKGYLILQCLKNGSVTQPNDGSVISIAVYARNSVTLIKGA
jgi:hypothetical protein